MVLSFLCRQRGRTARSVLDLDRRIDEDEREDFLLRPLRFLSIASLFTTSCTTVWVAPSFTGRVVDSRGNGIEGVSIARKHGGETRTIGTTDRDGNFRIDSVSEARFPAVLGTAESHGTYFFSKAGYDGAEVGWAYCCGEAFHESSLNTHAGATVVILKSK
jgi:hypothetical protein